MVNNNQYYNICKELSNINDNEKIKKLFFKNYIEDSKFINKPIFNIFHRKSDRTFNSLNNFKKIIKKEKEK